MDLTFSDPQGDLDVDVYDAAGHLITFSRSSDDNERIDDRLTPGTYFVKVWGWSSDTNSYDLFITFANGLVQADANEANDTSQQATQLGALPATLVRASMHLFPDHDWYRFELTASQTVTIELSNLSYVNNAVDLRLHQLGSQGHVNLLGSAGGTPGQGNIQLANQALAPGTYLIQVNPSPGTVSGGFIPFHYDLSVTP